MEKSEILHFSVAIIVCGLKMQSTLTPMNTKVHGLVVILAAKGHFG